MSTRLLTSWAGRFRSALAFNSTVRCLLAPLTSTYPMSPAIG
ncbi:MAG TPA: hypothetical protein VJT49_22575 [Amycolatopsis sp.]|nr:hypothetical protein [Amycolatopsis sp.]HKS47846.1 hypothetical protein [Amycolatopsis sp.]